MIYDQIALPTIFALQGHDDDFIEKFHLLWLATKHNIAVRLLLIHALIQDIDGLPRTSTSHHHTGVGRDTLCTSLVKTTQETC